MKITKWYKDKLDLIALNRKLKEQEIANKSLLNSIEGLAELLEAEREKNRRLILLVATIRNLVKEPLPL